LFAYIIMYNSRLVLEIWKILNLRKRKKIVSELYYQLLNSQILLLDFDFKILISNWVIRSIEKF